MYLKAKPVKGAYRLTLLQVNGTKARESSLFSTKGVGECFMEIQPQQLEQTNLITAGSHIAYVAKMAGNTFLKIQWRLPFSFHIPYHLHGVGGAYLKLASFHSTTNRSAAL